MVGGFLFGANYIKEVLMGDNGELYCYTGDASADLGIAVDTVAQAFGWKNTKRIWAETRGFKTHVESAINDYPQSGAVPEAELKYAFKKLINTPDIKGEIKGLIDSESVSGYGDDYYSDDDRFGYAVSHGYVETKTGRRLKAQMQEDLLMRAKTASDCEHLEARRTRKC